MRQFIAKLAAEWIEVELFHIAVAAARLPERTTVEEVLALALPQPDHAFYANSMAVLRCAEVQLLGATLMAAELARSERAADVARCITGLMWRAALEVAVARDLDVDTSLSGFPSGDFQLRHDLAQQVWEIWQATDAEVREATARFFLACGEAWDDDLLVQENRRGGAG